MARHGDTDPAVAGGSPSSRAPAGAALPALAGGPEFDLIRRFLAPARGTLAPPEVLLGAGDDCAVVRGAGLCVSADLCVEGVHFRRDWLSPHQIGWRAASAALSDLAAMAARPVGVLAALALPEADAGEFAVELMDGVRAAVEALGGVLLGGDLTRSPGPVVLDVVVIGATADPVLRSGAAVGDEVWVTGELGGAALAVQRLLVGDAPPGDAMSRFATPTPRVHEALWLQERGVLRAMLDLSDGLAGDAGHLAAASGVAIVLERERIPVHSAVASALSDRRALETAVSGGEDFELCFCAPKGAVEALGASFRDRFGVALCRVGLVEQGEGVFWREADGTRVPIDRGGFQHFGDRR